MRVLKARLAEASGDRPGSYSAVIEVEVPGVGEGVLYLRRLARRPGGVRARLSGGRVLLDILDDCGEGFACCVIDPRALGPPWRCSRG